MNHRNITAPILSAHPNTQAIYLYGSWGTEYQHRDSDLDVAVLLPFGESRNTDRWQWHLLATEVAAKIHVEYADLINLRGVDTTFQAEILRTGRLLYCTDEAARLQFETLVLSMYHKLNAERAEIRREIISSGRVLAP